MVWKVLFGAGMLLLEPLKLAPLESLLPNGTSQFGPPDCVHNKTLSFDLYFGQTRLRTMVTLTKTAESLAAKANASAQDTVFGHSSSNADLISSITSNPLAEFRLGFEFFSLIIPPLL